MAVVDAPDAPAAMLAGVVLLANVNRLHTLGAAVAAPTVAVEVVAVASFPDGVRFSDGHDRLPLVDSEIVARDGGDQ